MNFSVTPNLFTKSSFSVIYHILKSVFGIFDEELSQAQKIKCSALTKSSNFFPAKFNQNWVSFSYIPKNKQCKKVLKSNKGFRRYRGSKVRNDSAAWDKKEGKITKNCQLYF